MKPSSPTPTTAPDAAAKPKSSGMALELKFDMATLKALLPILKAAQPYLLGAALVGVFGYTAYIINAALNVQPAASQTTIQALPKVTFDKGVMQSLQDRNAVDASVPQASGSTNPF